MHSSLAISETSLKKKNYQLKPLKNNQFNIKKVKIITKNSDSDESNNKSNE